MSESPPRLLSAACLLALATACAPEQVQSFVDTDLLSHLPKHEAQRDALCARGRDDAVTRAFCGDEAPRVESLDDVLRLLDVRLADTEEGERPAFSMIAQSSALPSRSVSALNPGAVIVSLPEGGPPLNGNPGRRRTDGNVVSVAFARGDHVVEIVAAPAGWPPTFYLLRYEQACGDACTPAERYTSRTERDWTGWSLYDDGDLASSVFDCLHCHQPDGPGTPRILRMQELENPWTHWEATFTLNGRVLLDDTMRAHEGADTIAGVPTALVPRSDPVAVEDLIRFVDSPQPNLFPAPQIEQEVMASSPGQPRDNSTPGTSATWDAIYERAVRGEAIPPPHHDAKVTDAALLPAWIDDVNKAVRGADEDAMPELRDVFDPRALPRMSHRPMPGLDGMGILVHACAQCHHPRLDQSLSRARFDVFNLGALTDAEREAAIDRMFLTDDNRYRMPPHLFRDLSAEEKALAADAIRRAR